ncbi:unnamed protein product [Blepharisma stoltei]|uniref:Transmembrane protein n=1 Tax=Blepharisma stoltei TaxID=1481888 RepID=A0AAU9IGZ2_9CILI|nr:unnamed protein product [Blepharisma stoltei]
MASNYDPRSNRLQEFRFNNGHLDYTAYKIAPMQDYMTMEEYYKFSQRENTWLYIELGTLGTFGTLQWLVSKIAGWKAFSGFARTNIRVALGLGPFFFVRYFHNQDFTKRKDRIIMSKLNAAFENPMSKQLAL